MPGRICWTSRSQRALWRVIPRSFSRFGAIGGSSSGFAPELPGPFSGRCAQPATAFSVESAIVRPSGFDIHARTTATRSGPNVQLLGIEDEEISARSDRAGGFHRFGHGGGYGAPPPQGPPADAGRAELDRFLHLRRRRRRYLGS